MRAEWRQTELPSAWVSNKIAAVDYQVPTTGFGKVETYVGAYGLRRETSREHVQDYPECIDPEG